MICPPPTSTLFPYTTLFRSREHGVLKRVLLIYGEVLRRIDAKQDFPPEALADAARIIRNFRSEEHTSELQSRGHLVCRLLLEKKNSYCVRQLCQLPTAPRFF